MVSWERSCLLPQVGDNFQGRYFNNDDDDDDDDDDLK